MLSEHCFQPMFLTDMRALCTSPVRYSFRCVEHNGGGIEPQGRTDLRAFKMLLTSGCGVAVPPHPPPPPVCVAPGGERISLSTQQNTPTSVGKQSRSHSKQQRCSLFTAFPGPDCFLGPCPCLGRRTNEKKKGGSNLLYLKSSSGADRLGVIAPGCTGSRDAYR